MESLSASWPWYVVGPAIGLVAILLLWVDGRVFGVSSSLRHVCAIALGGRGPAYFRYDWKSVGAWNLIFVLGILVGGWVSQNLIRSEPPMVQVSSATWETMNELGIEKQPGLLPAELFNWQSFQNPWGLILLVGGGFLVGFGARYANGCTSGHGISGLANFQVASLVAVCAFMVGGILVSIYLIPVLVRGLS
ncbi:MAG: YeeE/YedE family protein [Candidatus Eisenbacteria bacterium]|uniref:YeeE/YedE family protein n=1 Tax=Eiseniibacteriota bacterium TaxID=2212470 RepID=A0A7Y2EGV8_UNCEI|nr:YeeE/YedE family protein [Candidatus Eisenbacteria bacterium]